MNEWDVFLSGESAIWCDLVFFTCPTIEGPLPVAKIVIHSGYKEPMCLSSLSSWYIEVFVCFQFFPLRPRCLRLSPQHRCLYLHQPNKTVQTLPIWEGEPPPPNQQHLFCFLCKLLPCFLSLIRSHQLCMCVCVCSVCLGRETFGPWLPGAGHPDQRQDVNHRRYPHRWQAWHFR